MKPSDLTPFVYAVTVAAWVSAVLLVRIANQPPTVPVLLERAWVSVAVALFLTVYAVAILNADIRFAWFDDATGRIIARLGAILLGTIPVGWLGLYAWRKR